MFIYKDYYLPLVVNDLFRVSIVPLYYIHTIITLVKYRLQVDFIMYTIFAPTLCNMYILTITFFFF